MENEPRLSFGPSGNPTVEIDGEEDGDFEFAFSIESDPGDLSEITADKIFHNGRILPVYPVFNRDLIAGDLAAEEEKQAEEVGRLAVDFEKRDLRSGSASSSSSNSPEAEDLDRIRGAAPENFVWAPRSAPQSPIRCRKSSSTGSSTLDSRRWKLKDLVVGRSRSDGKERFLILQPSEERGKGKKILLKLNSNAKTAAAAAEAEKKGKSGKWKGGTVKEMDIVTAHRIYYGKGGSGGGQPAAASDSRRSFLPYRQQLIGGLFGNARHQPF